MEWTRGGRGDISDQRGRWGGLGVAHLGIGGFLVVLVLSWLSGTNLFSLLGNDISVPTQSVGTDGRVASSPAEERLVDEVAAVNKGAQEMWAVTLGSSDRRNRVSFVR